MGIAKQLKSVIEWSDPQPDVLFMRWSEADDEIKNASKLIVGPGQGCLFVYEGQVREVYEEEGVVDLRTDNIPFWTSIKSLMQGMQSAHKVGIYYFRRAEMVNMRWGTPAPIKYVDPVYNFPVGLRAYGNYSLKIVEPKAFFTDIVAGGSLYGASDIQALLLSRITPGITDYLAKSRLSYGEVDAHRLDISKAVVHALEPIFHDLGFAMTDFRIEGTSFDDDTQDRIAMIADMSAEAQAAAAAGIDYVQKQQLDAMKEAARNPGAAGMAAGIGTGMGLGKMMEGAFQGSAQDNTGGDADIETRLAKLKRMFENDLITEQEYESKRQALLEEL